MIGLSNERLTKERIVTMDSPLMSVQDIAKYIRVHEMTVYRWLKQGKIPGIKLGGRWRAYKSTLDIFLTKKQNIPNV